MVIGIGTDILKIQRVRDGFGGSGDAFIRKSFTKKEQVEAKTRSDPALFFATRFAGKEAVFKCLGVDGSGIRLNEIEILGADTGQPQVTLLGDIRDIASQKGIRKIRVSLSYDSEYTVAFALAEG
jgi:phosphopantetheine--protein transferase-like protein